MGAQIIHSFCLAWQISKRVIVPAASQIVSSLLILFSPGYLIHFPCTGNVDMVGLALTDPSIIAMLCNQTGSQDYCKRWP